MTCFGGDVVVQHSPGLPSTAESVDVLGASGDALTGFKADRPNFSSNNSKAVDIFDKELALLRAGHFSDLDKPIDLATDDARARAPQVCAFVVNIVRRAANLAKIKMPGVHLLMKDGSGQYNAAAQRTKQTITTTERLVEIDVRGRQKVVGEKVTTDKNVINDIVIGAELVRLFMWRKEYVSLFAAIIGHEIGHIVFEHDEEDPMNEHQADVFAARLLRHGKDLIVALDIISLAAHLHNALKSFGLDQRKVYDHIRAVVNRIIIDIPDLGELGTAESHSYVATAVHHALKKADREVIISGAVDEVRFEIYSAVKSVCNAPTSVFGVDAEEIQKMCAKMEQDADHLQGLKRTHPVPLNRRAIIAAVTRKEGEGEFD